MGPGHCGTLCKFTRKNMDENDEIDGQKNTDD